MLHLNADAVTRYWEGIHPSPSMWTSGYANLDLHDIGKPNSVRVGFNPAEAFFRDLQVCHFFFSNLYKRRNVRMLAYIRRRHRILLRHSRWNSNWGNLAPGPQYPKAMEGLSRIFFESRLG